MVTFYSDRILAMTSGCEVQVEISKIIGVLKYLIFKESFFKQYIGIGQLLSDSENRNFIITFGNRQLLDSILLYI